MTDFESIDWAACPLVEIKPEVQSGAPVLIGTRMPASAIIDNFDFGLTIPEISEQFEIPQDLVSQILIYAESHRVAHPV
jgi:uncharacterized protein (DUF433 family)